jgi:hypothetical protein
MTARRPPPSLSMYWIVLAIAVFVVGYTFLRLHYSRGGKPFEPYHDLGEQTAVRRLLGLGYQRIPVEVGRPADPLPESRFAPVTTDVTSASGGLPSELTSALGRTPYLPGSIIHVAAPREATATATYMLQFTCAQPDYTTQIDGAYLYRKGGRIFLLPRFEKTPGQLLARWRESVVVVSFPTQSLPPGRYSITLCGGRTSKSWEFTIR